MKGKELLFLLKNKNNLLHNSSLYCVILKLIFRQNFESKNICVEIPKIEERPIRILWPKNNSIHSFPEVKKFKKLFK